MPIYMYEHPETGEVIEIIQGMNEDHTYTDSDKVKWNRVFTSPNASFDTQVDPFSQSDYMKATENKKGTFGELMDYSKDLSRERASKNGGVDPVAEKFYSDHEKKTGQKHPSKAKVYESKNVKVEYD
jgi:predicted nucleic acid-binding Zn ribbon protein